MRLLFLFFIAMSVLGCERSAVTIAPKHPKVSFYVREGQYRSTSDVMDGDGSVMHNIQLGATTQNPIVQGTGNFRADIFGKGDKWKLVANFLGHDPKGDDLYEILMERTTLFGVEKIGFQTTYEGKPIVILNRPNMHMGMVPTPP